MKTSEIKQYEDWTKREKKNADFNYKTWEDIEDGFASEIRQITYLWNHDFFEKMSPLCENFDFFYPYSFMINWDCYYTFDLKKDGLTCRFCIAKAHEGEGEFVYKSSILFENGNGQFIPINKYFSPFISKIQPVINEMVPIFEAIEKELLKEKDVRLRLLFNTLYINKSWKESIQDKGFTLKNS